MKHDPFVDRTAQGIRALRSHFRGYYDLAGLKFSIEVSELSAAPSFRQAQDPITPVASDFESPSANRIAFTAEVVVTGGIDPKTDMHLGFPGKTLEFRDGRFRPLPLEGLGNFDPDLNSADFESS